MRLALALVVLVAALVIAGCGGNPGVSSGESLSTGKELFVNGNAGVSVPACGACHVLEAAGPRAQGRIGPNLDDGFGPARAQGFEIDTFEQVIREQMEIPGAPTDVALNDDDGAPRTPMPSRDDYGFTDAQANDIALYVATCAGLPYLPEDDPETAAAIALCASVPEAPEPEAPEPEPADG